MIPAAIAGNLTADPEVRTAGTRTVARFTIACDDEYRGSDGAWHKNPPVFVTVECWDAIARGVQTQLTKGSPAVVIGRWKAAEYEVEGQRRRKQYVVAEAVGRSVRETKPVSSTSDRKQGPPEGSDPAQKQASVAESIADAGDDFWSAAQ